MGEKQKRNEVPTISLFRTSVNQILVCNNKMVYALISPTETTISNMGKQMHIHAAKPHQRKETKESKTRVQIKRK